MPESELAFAGVAGQAERLRRGVASSRDLVELSLARIAALDPDLNAFGAVYAERAREDADRADARRAAGEDAPLLGIPMAVKDEIDLAGEVTSRGTGAFTERAAEDAKSCAGCGRPARWSSARRRCRSSACGRSPSRSPGA